MTRRGGARRWRAGVRWRRSRVPVILQLTQTECAAACLAMVLTFHGRKTSLREARRALDPGRDGTTAQALTSAARSFGLEATAFSTSLDGLAPVELPAVLHWHLTHFVVLERWSRGGAMIVDPSHGRLQIDRAALEANFTGIVMCFRRTGEPSSIRNQGDPRWTYFLRDLTAMRSRIGVLLGASLVLSLSGLAIPVVTALVVDRVIPTTDTTLLPLIGIIAALLVCNQLLVSFIRERLLIFLRVRLDVAFTTRFLRHLFSLPLPFFEQRGTGDLLTRISGNTAIQQTMSAFALGAVLDGMFVFVYLAILLAQDPSFALIVIAFAALEAFTFLGMMKRLNLLHRRELAAKASTQNLVVQALSGIGSLKASGWEERTLKLWSGLYDTEIEQTVGVNRVQATITTFSTGLRLLVPLTLLLYGAYQVMSGALSLGTMFAFVALATAFLAPVRSLVATALQIQRTGAQLDRLVDVLAAEPEQRVDAAGADRRLSGAIELRDVSFRFQANGPLVLRHISLSIRAGEVIGIAGRSGSGKTTLAKLLLGLYSPSAGEILYDGMPLDRYDLSSLRSQVGVVMQDATTFGGTIRENIAFHDPELPLEHVREAAKIASLHDEVDAMPLGYDTPIGDGGQYVSGGQRQRLVLARAIASNPALLLLDEATSHLDAVSEASITTNLSRLSCTRIVVAHRLSTIREADRIVVLDSGVVVESGSHEELLALRGHYERLIFRQLEREVSVL